MLANKKGASRIAAATLCLSLLAGCATMPAGMPNMSLAGPAGTAPPGLAGPLPPPIARAWPDQAQDVLNQRARNYGLVNAPDLQRYLNSLYARVKSQAGVADWPGAVYLLADESLNAYATGAGNIYLSLPWLSSVESEDELVALLSHEFGHVYLHYHELEGAIAGADMAAGAVGVGVALVHKTGQVSGWNKLDSLVAVYTVAKGVATTMYGRSQESAADHFGLNLSLKMGYSYEHGMKVFLERIASWEESNDLLKVRAQDQQIAALRKDAIAKAAKPAAGQGAVQQKVAQSTGELSAGIGSTLQQLSFDLERTMGKMRSDHPEITARIDALALAMDAAPALQADRQAVVAPLSAARKNKRTAATISNYTLAFKAMGAPKDPASLAAARAAITGPTATHAVPLLALYTVLQEQPGPQGRKRVDPDQLLEANFRSEPDRAWKTYLIQGVRLSARHQKAPANKVIESGLAYFGKAEDAWPDAIRFYGETQGWDEAKRLAAECGKQFRLAAARCTAAATSPSEHADVKRKSEAKAEQIVDKMFKKRK